MRDRGVILGGLAVFLALAAFPLWYNALRGRTARPPDLRLPATAKQCVAPVAYMKTSHMRLLLAWREDVVRRGIRTWRAPDGKAYNMSLTNTCLKECHTNKAEFCDRCHAYAGVDNPYCFECHSDPGNMTWRASQ